MTSSELRYNGSSTDSFLLEVSKRSGQNLLVCYQCRRCAAGCPVGGESKVTPDHLIRLIVMGDREKALNNLLVWKCVACYTCGTRCPNNIQTARINETLKHMSKETACEPLIPRVSYFHEAFMKSVRSSGRLNEIEFMRLYETKTIMKEMSTSGINGAWREILKQTKLAVDMLKKKRLHFKASRIKGVSEIRRLYGRAKGK